MTEEVDTAASIATIPVWLSPWICNDEIDVSWNNYGKPARISVDRTVKGVLSHELVKVSPTTQWDDFSAIYTNTTYAYYIYNYDSSTHMMANGSQSVYVSTCATQFSTAFIQDHTPKSSINENDALVLPVSSTGNIKGGTLELLVPYGSVINHYIHQTGVTDSHEDWQLLRTLQLPGDTHTQATAVSLVQISSGNLEVIARVTPSQGSPYLVGYEFDASSNWKGPVTLMTDEGPIDNVTGFAAMIQTNYNQQDQLELLVPRGTEIDHYIQDTRTIPEGLWRRIHTLKVPSNDPQAQITAVAFIQSIPGRLVAIARVTPPSSLLPQRSDYLVGYELNPPGDWTGPFPLVADDGAINKVTGTMSFIESNFYDQDKFELLVPRGAVIEHYTHTRGSIADGSWQHAHTLPAPSDHSPQFGAVWLLPSFSVRIESIARVKPAGGSAHLVGYEFNPTSSEWSGPVPLRTKDGPILSNDPQPPVQGGPGCQPRAILTLLGLALLVRVLLGILSKNRSRPRRTKKAIH